MALGETFDLGRIIATAEQIKGMKRQEEKDKLESAYFQQRMTNDAAQAKRESQKFDQEQQLFNTRMLNLAATSVAADPSSLSRWKPELVKAGVLDPNFDESQLGPEVVQQAAAQLAKQTGTELQAYLQANPAMMEIAARHDVTLKEIQARIDGEKEIAGVQNRYAIEQIGARGAQDRATEATKAPGRDRKAATDLRKEFEGMDAVKNYKAALPGVESAKRAPDTGYGDLDLIYAVGKTLDPGSVVREGELTLTIAAGSPIERAIGATRFTIGQGGRLTKNQRTQLVQMLENRVGQLAAAYDQERGRYASYAQEYGLEPSQVVGASAPSDAFKPQGGSGLAVGQSVQIGGATVKRKN